MKKNVTSLKLKAFNRVLAEEMHVKMDKVTKVSSKLLIKNIAAVGLTEQYVYCKEHNLVVSKLNTKVIDRLPCVSKLADCKSETVNLFVSDKDEDGQLIELVKPVMSESEDTTNTVDSDITIADFDKIHDMIDTVITEAVGDTYMGGAGPYTGAAVNAINLMQTIVNLTNNSDPHGLMAIDTSIPQDEKTPEEKEEESKRRLSMIQSSETPAVLESTDQSKHKLVNLVDYIVSRKSKK